MTMIDEIADQMEKEQQQEPSDEPHVLVLPPSPKLVPKAVLSVQPASRGSQPFSLVTPHRHLHRAGFLAVLFLYEL